MRSVELGTGAMALAALGVVLAGCSSEPEGPGPASSRTPGGGLEEPAHACEDVAAALYGAPPSDFAEKARGTVLRCLRDPDQDAAALTAAVRPSGYAGTLASGARVYRVLYRTERGTVPPTPGYGVATVYVPTAPRRASLPAVVVARGSRGQAGFCAPSLDDERASSVRNDYLSLVLPLVGAGYAVIAPDFAGYSNFGAPGNPPSGYGNAADVSKSVLDAARALRLLFPDAVTKKTVLVGFSQGAHAALASLARAEVEAYDGEMAGVVAYAPLWFNQAVFGAVLFAAGQFPISTFANIPNGASFWYHYTVGALLDGPEKALEPFAPAKREGVRKWVESACWGPQPQLEALGKDARDLYSPEFQEAVTAMAAYGSPCPASEPAHTTCETWRARYRAERPRIQGKAAEVPILVAYGGQDTALSPSRMQCALTRLVEQDKARVDVCIDPGAEHGGETGIVRRKADYVSAWIDHVTAGAPAPGACERTSLVASDGSKVPCEVFPPNDADL